MDSIHTPVLLKEVIEYLRPAPGQNFIDATADGGGHTLAILRAIQPSGKLLALEWDEELLRVLEVRLNKECPGLSKNCILKQADYTDLAACVRLLKFGPVAGILFDFGMSSFHIGESRRGFSFQKDEELDMRYSRTIQETAADILRTRSRDELESMLKSLGEERFARSIAKGITEARRLKPVERTGELVEIIRRSVPSWYRRGRLHFATKTFQALRLAVNHELENVERGLAAAAGTIASKGRIAAITFHSLEDRIVKNFFRREDINPPTLSRSVESREKDLKLLYTPAEKPQGIREGGGIKENFTVITKKPIRPSLEEIKLNPRSRSSRLRVYEKNENSR